MWRVMKGLRKSIEMSFMLVGHTKFSLDWCFDLLEPRFCVTKVGCLSDFVDVVNALVSVIEAQLVGSQKSLLF